MTMAPRIRLELLGTPTVYRDDVPVPALRARIRNLAVLVLVAMEREVARDRLASLIWGDSPPRRARQSLSEALYELRKALGDAWYTEEGSILRISEEVEVDALTFARDVEAGGPRAPRLYRGHFLQDVELDVHDFDDWVDRKRRDFLNVYRGAARAAIRGALERDDPTSGLKGARDWVEQEGLDDEAHHLLVASLFLAGDRAGAVRHFEAYERLLAREELTPLDGTQALARAVRAGDTTAVRSLLDLSPVEQATASDRHTSALWPRPDPGPRLLRITRPAAMEGEAITLGDSTPLGLPEGGVSVERVERNGASRFVLRIPPGAEVYLLLRSPQPLREGDVFRAGEQRYTLTTPPTPPWP